MLVSASVVALRQIMLWPEARYVPMSIPEEKRSPQYQMRLPIKFREQLEEQARKDGDASLATWIKRILRKELRERGVDPKG